MALTEEEADQIIDLIEETLTGAGIDTFFVCFHRPLVKGDPSNETTAHYTGCGPSDELLDLLERCKQILKGNAT